MAGFDYYNKTKRCDLSKSVASKVGGLFNSKGTYDHYSLKSTNSTKCKYIYLHHSPVSFTLIYLPDAFNDFDAVERCVKDHHGEIAAMFVEPCLGNIVGIEPKDGFLSHLRTLCNEYSIVLVFDEVKTGFRLSNGGARETYGVIPDISTYAKSLGNGFPVAAFGGQKEVMDVIGGGSVTHAGTFSANGLSMAAANAVLDILSESPVLENLAKRGKKLKTGLDQVLTDAGLPHQMSGHPNIQGFLIT